MDSYSTSYSSTGSSEPCAVCTHYKWDEADCWKCWAEKFPPAEIKQEMKLNNRKYCTLYPKEQRKKLVKELLPDFQHCNKNIYTKCDFQLEACVYEQILKAEDEFKAHEKLVNAEMVKQNGWCKQLWESVHRLLILRVSGVYIKPYPEVVSLPEEKRLSCEISKLLKRIHLSNCSMSNSLANIQSTLRKMERCIARLDLTLESTLLAGGSGVKYRPLAYIREIIGDLHEYFFVMISKLKSWAQLLTPCDIHAIENYRALIHPSKDYECPLETDLKDCTCLRPKKRDPTKQKQPCRKH